MHRLVEVVRLHREGTSARKIARLMRMGRDTIRGYLSKLAEADLLEGAAEDLPDAGVIAEAIGLANACQDTNCEESVNSTADRWRASILAFVKKGVGPTAIHDHLRLHDPDYTASLSAVKRMCLRLKKERGPQPEDIAIPVVTLPGAIAQVDFGYVGMIYDQDRGAPRKAWVFVMTLGFSRRTFADIVYDQKIETWLSLHVAAFEHFGGVPEVIVPDNLKSAVIRCAFGVDVDPVLNRSYRELARFYGFQIDPTPPRSPEKKGKVERDVRYLKGNFFATWESVDLPTDRKALWRWLAEVADLRIHGTTRRRPIDLLSGVTSKPASQGRIKTGHLSVGFGLLFVARFRKLLVSKSVALALDRDDLSVLEESVEDRRRRRHILQQLAPVFDWSIRSHDRGPSFMPSHDDLEEVLA